MKNKKKGFTLIELLVVIAIIGILSAIGLVALNGAREKARDAQRRSDLAQYRTALVMYADDNGGIYPATIDASGAGPDTSNVASSGSIFDSTAATNPLVTEYLGAVLLDPTNDPTYHYVYDTNESAATGSANDSFVLYVELEGGDKDTYSLTDDGVNQEEPTAPDACDTQDVCPGAT